MQHKNEQELYHAVVKVGTLLTSLGDAGKNIKGSLRSPTKQQADSAVKDGPKSVDSTDAEGPGCLNAKRTSLTLPLTRDTKNDDTLGATGEPIEVYMAP